MEEKPVLDVRAIVIEQGHLAVVRRQNVPGRDDYLALPGGKRKPDEGLLGAIRREMEEETNLDIVRPTWIPPLLRFYDRLSRLVVRWVFAVETGENQTDNCLPDLLFEGRFIFDEGWGRCQAAWVPLGEIDLATLQPRGVGEIVRAYLKSRVV